MAGSGRLFGGLFAVLAAYASPALSAEFVVQAVTIPEAKAVFGRVESRTVLPARARIGGAIREIRVSEGDEVEEGQTIALVVDEKLAIELTAAEAKIRALASQLENARVELDRAQQLLARGVGTQTRLDQARTQFDVVVNQVAAAEAEREVVRQRAREGEVQAPANGRVLTVPVRPGSVILAGEELARIASGGYFLRLSLPERHAAEIVEGGAVVVGRRGMSVAEARGEAPRDGRIVKVYPEIADGRVIADVVVEGLGDYFVNERTVVWIPVGKRIALAVPPAAVRTRHGVDYVRVVMPGGELETAVVLGESFDLGAGSRIEVLTGLRDGDRVVLP